MPHDPVRNIFDKILEEYKTWNSTPMSDEGIEHLNESFARSRLKTILRLYTASQHHSDDSLGDELTEMHEFFTHCSSLLFDVLPVQVENDEHALRMLTYIYGLIASVWRDGVETERGRTT